MAKHEHRWEAYQLEQGETMHWCYDCGVLMLRRPPPPGTKVEEIKKPGYQLPVQRRSDGYTPPDLPTGASA